MKILSQAKNYYSAKSTLGTHLQMQKNDKFIEKLINEKYMKSKCQ